MTFSTVTKLGPLKFPMKMTTVKRCNYSLVIIDNSSSVDVVVCVFSTLHCNIYFTAAYVEQRNFNCTTRPRYTVAVVITMLVHVHQKQTSTK